jgi:ABC-type antimicrobial peptide transport system permease subunit
VRFGARPGPETIGGEIVGIVGDVRAFGLDGDPTPMFYGNIDQVQVGFASVVVRTTGDPTSLAAPARSVVQALDRDLPVIGLATLDRLVGASIARPRFYMLLLTIFAGVALLLASVGIYGVFSYLVSQRTREIGIRIALGAARHDVLSLIMGRALRLVLLGVGLGVFATLGLNRFLIRLLFGVSPTDPGTMTGVSLFLAGIAFVACYLPARRASRVDPAITLRSE